MTVLDEAEVERLLVAAFDDARATVDGHPDLFARVERSIEEAAARRRFRWRLGAGVAGAVAGLASLGLGLSDVRDGRLVMPWWVLELVTGLVLVLLAVALGPFIKRFGRAYAADVFRRNPRTGKSYLVLTDVAYYLIFLAYILVTTRVVPNEEWASSPGTQVQHELGRIGGILLLMGVLHTANVVALPMIGNLLGGAAGRVGGNRRTDGPAPPGALGPGTWILRIESPPTTTGDEQGRPGPTAG